MKVQPRTKLSPTDLLPYAPGRTGAGSSSKAFQLDPLDLSPAKPGVSSKTGDDAKLNPLDLSTFRPGHPGKAELKPLDLSRPPAQIAASSAGKSQHDQLTEKTQKWVSQTFFGTLLKQMGDSPFKSELFSGGQGGQSFGSLYDQHLAEHMTRGAGSKLVNGIVRRIEANAAYRKQAAQESGKSDNRTGGRNNGKSRTMRSHGATALRA